MLLLVELTRLDPREGHAEPVDGATDIEEDFGIVRADELRAHDPRVRPVGLLHEQPHDVGREHHVVVAEHEERGPFDGPEGLVGGFRETGGRFEAPDERAGQPGGDPGCRVHVRAAVDDQHGQIRVVLAYEGVERFVEPFPGVARDDHGHDRRVDRGELLEVARIAGGIVVRLLGELVERVGVTSPALGRIGSFPRPRRRQPARSVGGVHQAQQRTADSTPSRHAAAGHAAGTLSR